MASLASRPTFQKGLAQHVSAWRAARLLVLDAFTTAEAAVAAGDDLTPVRRADMRAAAVYATDVARQCAEWSHLVAGTSSIREGSRLERAFRDIYTGTQHALISEKMAIETIRELGERKVLIKSLTEPVIDTTSAMGRALYGIVAVFAQLRVDTIRENTVRGLAYARSQGRVGGRRTVMTPDRVKTAREMRAENVSYARIASTLGVGASSVRRALENETQSLSAEEGSGGDAHR